MTRERAIAAAEAYFDEGGFAEDLARSLALLGSALAGFGIFLRRRRST
jgi:hypothetical protein